MRTKLTCSVLIGYVVVVLFIYLFLGLLGRKRVLRLYLCVTTRFVNREGIDFSDAQGMQAVQVLLQLQFLR